MAVHITINGDNAGHAVGELCNFVAGMHAELTKMAQGTRPVTVPTVPVASVTTSASTAGMTAGQEADTAAKAVVAENATAAASTAPAADAGKKKRTKAAKDAAPAAPPAQAVELPTDETPTLDNARAWVQAVNGKLGLDPAAKIITSFGVKKVSDMAAEKYADFITKCKHALTGIETAVKNDVASMM